MAKGFGPPTKRVQWFPGYGRLFAKVTAQCCTNLHDHPADRACPGKVDRNLSPDCPDAFNLVGCVQDALPVVKQVQLTASQVMPGLTPTLAAAIAPSIGEDLNAFVLPSLAELSSERGQAQRRIRAE